MKFSLPLVTSENQFKSNTLLGDLETRLSRMAELGYNGVDLAVRDRRFIDPKSLSAILGRDHLEVASLNTDPLWVEERISLADPEGSIRKATLTRVLGYIPLAYQLKAILCIGIVRGDGVGVEAEEANGWLVDALKALCTTADEYDVRIALEPLNHQMTSIVNTVRQGLDILQQVDRYNLGLALNTYHMNAEETMIEEVIRLCTGKLLQVKVADSNRRMPGSRYINFGSILKTLKAIGYQGYLSGDFLPVPTADAAAQRSITYLRALI